MEPDAEHSPKRRRLLGPEPPFEGDENVVDDTDDFYGNNEPASAAIADAASSDRPKSPHPSHPPTTSPQERIPSSLPGLDLLAHQEDNADFAHDIDIVEDGLVKITGDEEMQHGSGSGEQIQSPITQDGNGGSQAAPIKLDSTGVINFDVSTATSVGTVAATSTKESKETTEGSGSNGIPDVPQTSLTANGGHEGAEWEYDSSADSDDTSSTSSTSQESDQASDESMDETRSEYELLDPAEQARRLMNDDHDQDGEKASQGRPKTMHEDTDIKVEKPQIDMTPDTEIQPLGTVQKTVEQFVLVQAFVSAEHNVLCSGSVLCLEDRRIIGTVYEPLGRVRQPFYSIAFNDTSEIADLGLEPGTKVFYVPTNSTFAFTQSLKVRGSDASNLHDEEIGADEAEFSDDEKEAAFRKRQKQERSQKRQARFEEPKVEGSAAPLSRIGEDDGADGLYTPLKRPDDFSSLPTKPPVTASMKTHSQPNHSARGRKQRGSGRSRFRDRTSNGNQRRMHNPSHESADRQSIGVQNSSMDYGDSRHRDQPNFPTFAMPTEQLQQYPLPGNGIVPNYNVMPLPQYPHFPTPPTVDNTHYASGMGNGFAWNGNANPYNPISPPANLASGQSIPPGAFVNPAFFSQPRAGERQSSFSSVQVPTNQYGQQQNFWWDATSGKR